MDFLKGICATNSQKHSSEKRIMLDSKKLPKKSSSASSKKFQWASEGPSLRGLTCHGCCVSATALVRVNPSRNKHTSERAVTVHPPHED